MEESKLVNAKLRDVAEEFGREIRVFPTCSAPAPSLPRMKEENDDIYDFTAEDYYRLLASKKKKDKFLKTRKIREAEEAARRSKLTKAVIRVRFPDNVTLEAKFHPSETMQDLIDLLGRVVARPDIPFFVYTTPPKQRMADMSMTLYKAGFVPGAIVYFSYEGEIKIGNGGQFLKEEIMGLNGVELIIGEDDEQVKAVQSAMEAVKVDEHMVNVAEVKPASNKPVKPKWLRL